ncbi:hypothetical protein [Aminobacterium mobile]|jgi:hypothetical protein|uniref:hypothetical protein n=1 Tax=Aminobacterium mobile TaxID=81467 RepID=UPI0004664871|nr:hypothetical protein [Aminobacterium mobile]
MSDEMVLLLFDTFHPCWDEETVFWAGEDVEGLRRLRELGMLKEKNGIYSLTSHGRETFQELCRQWFCENKPGSASLGDKEQEIFLWRTRFQYILDGGFAARWGAKDYYPGKVLEYAPALSQQEMYALHNPSSVEWTYCSHPYVEKIKSHFPVTGLKAREVTPLSRDAARSWLDENNIPVGSFEVDLLLLGRYDFAYYMNFSKHPNDPLGLVNSDKFFFFRAQPPFSKQLPFFLESIGKIHLFLLNQRHMYIPGYVDLDSADQDSLNWLVWVVETEEDVFALLRLLVPMGQILIEPAKPMDIWVLSIEELRKVKEKHETIYDLFSSIGHPIVRNL